METEILRVFLQVQGDRLHPVSQRILTTARALGKGYRTQGIVLTDRMETLRTLEQSGLDEILVFEGIQGFYPEVMEAVLDRLERCEICLFPATPEGRAWSAYGAALLHTGVTADCTRLTITEDGSLLQVRPGFSGSRLAQIRTRTRPQMASLRFGTKAEAPAAATAVFRRTLHGEPIYPVQWTQRLGEIPASGKNLVAIGGGLREKGQIAVFEHLAEKLGAELVCSRALVDRGWMGRDRQIGLSGRTVSPDKLLCFGISGSLQFRAGLDRVGTLMAVNLDPEAPIMKLADLPIMADLLDTALAMLQNLS